MGPLLQQLQSRWQVMFAALAAGDDLPPGDRLRAEGIMEAAVVSGEASANEVDVAMAGAYLNAFGRTMEDDFRADWRDFYPFPQIPAMSRRAPVFPSTPD